MTKYEVKDKLSEYYNASQEVDCLKKRLERLKSINEPDTEVKNRIEQVNVLYKNAVLKTDFALATTLELINKLNNADGDADVLRKYHIEGLSEKTIARQMSLSVDYIRTKRWRAYQKISAIK